MTDSSMKVMKVIHVSLHERGHDRIHAITRFSLSALCGLCGKQVFPGSQLHVLHGEIISSDGIRTIADLELLCNACCWLYKAKKNFP